MALKPCKECGNEISDKAISCPHCGATQPKKTSLLVKILAWFFGISLFVGIFGGMFANNDVPSRSSVNNIESGEVNNSVTNKSEEINTENWRYDNLRDDLHNSGIKFATTTSLNKANFNFPYNGGSNLILAVRKNHAGYDVYITITKGQFVCGIVDGCEVAFKFDDGNIMNITMVKPDSHDSDTLFVKLDSTEQKIINKLKASKRLIIAPKFYQYGDVQFAFDVSNYKPI